LKTAKFKILEYSAISACFLALHESAQGQAVYTDIDPDVILDSEGESTVVDMNNDGISDFAFLNRSFDFYTEYSSYISHLEAIDAGPQSPNNEIAALTHVISPSYGGFTVYFPFALNESEMINDSLIFHNNSFQRMAYLYIDKSGFYFPKGGFWYPEVLDHYIGVRFIDTADCQHYGWIRCDVKDEGRTLVIKDYAYETKCDVGILAGDTIGDTTTVDIVGSGQGQLAAEVYSFENTIYVKLNELMNDVEIHVCDLTGKEVYSSVLTTQSAQIKLNEAKGVYFVEIVSGENKMGKKVFVN